MSNIPYSMLIRNSKHPEIIRERMVQRYYQVLNCSQVAREYHTKRQTVKFWVQRYKEEGIEGLKDKSRAPRHIPHKTPEWIEDEIERIAKGKKKSIGQDRIQLELHKVGLHCSTSTINRIMHDRDLIKERKKNWSYDLICSIRFAQAILEHLRRFGIHSSEITIQTDNGSEFIGSITKKELSGFEVLIEKIYHGKHQTIPIGKKEWQGSVENFHDRIEDEFYDIETFNSLPQFLGKAWTFNLYWNLEREKIKIKKTPFYLIKEKCHIFDPSIANFQPFLLDEMKTIWIPHYLQKSVPYVADDLTP